LGGDVLGLAACENRSHCALHLRGTSDRGGRIDPTAELSTVRTVLINRGFGPIVRYVAHGVTSAGELFLAMEWIDGEVLKTRLQRGSLTVTEAVTLATRVAEALGAAHARGVVHRDLKPSNLILPGGRVDLVKLLDFGIAQRDGKTQLTQTGAMLGTPGYMAPEQARPSGQIDARADVFALGCVLFECLTGVAPFEGNTTAAILAKILFGTAPRVSELWPEVPESLDALVAQMLSKEPALRPGDGANLAAALAALGSLVHTTATRGRAVRPRAATSAERRLLTVVMLGPGTHDDQPRPGPPPRGRDLDRPRRLAARRFHARPAGPGAAWRARPPRGRAAVRAPR
jgi:serine/threonine protein kinase